MKARDLRHKFDFDFPAIEKTLDTLLLQGDATIRGKIEELISDIKDEELLQTILYRLYMDESVAVENSNVLPDILLALDNPLSKQATRKLLLLYLVRVVNPAKTFGDGFYLTDLSLAKVLALGGNNWLLAGSFPSQYRESVILLIQHIVYLNPKQIRALFAGLENMLLKVLDISKINLCLVGNSLLTAEQWNAFFTEIKRLDLSHIVRFKFSGIRLHRFDDEMWAAFFSGICGLPLPALMQLDMHAGNHIDKSSDKHRRAKRLIDLIEFYGANSFADEAITEVNIYWLLEFIKANPDYRERTFKIVMRSTRYFQKHITDAVDLQRLLEAFPEGEESIVNRALNENIYRNFLSSVSHMKDFSAKFPKYGDLFIMACLRNLTFLKFNCNFDFAAKFLETFPHLQSEFLDIILTGEGVWIDEFEEPQSLFERCFSAIDEALKLERNLLGASKGRVIQKILDNPEHFERLINDKYSFNSLTRSEVCEAYLGQIFYKLFTSHLIFSRVINSEEEFNRWKEITESMKQHNILDEHVYMDILSQPNLASALALIPKRNSVFESINTDIVKDEVEVTASEFDVRDFSHKIELRKIARVLGQGSRDKSTPFSNLSSHLLVKIGIFSVNWFNLPPDPKSIMHDHFGKPKIGKK